MLLVAGAIVIGLLCAQREPARAKALATRSGLGMAGARSRLTGGWMTFRDRREAGRLLAARLAHLAGERPVVLALPRGGVPVGFEIARSLGAPLDVLVVRKIGAPWHPELGLGAIAEGRIVLLDEQIVEASGADRAVLLEIVKEEQAELERRVLRYRGGRPLPDLTDRTVTLVDDGVAMGGTMRAAVEAVRSLARRVVVAVPVGSPETLTRLGREADEVVALAAPHDLMAIGLWYEDFHQVTDEEVLTLLEASHADADASADVTRTSRLLRVPAGDALLEGDLDVPSGACGLILFAHGSGSSRFSPRNRGVARALHQAGLGTLLVDLLTRDEEELDLGTAELRFDVPLLARRVAAAVDFLRGRGDLSALPIGLFGSSTGATAALVAAALRPRAVAAVVSRGGRPDLAGSLLGRVVAPTLLVVGSRDEQVLELNRRALAALAGEKRLAIIPGATHLFEEPGALAEVARLAAEWFREHLARPATVEEPSA
jgi:putative phosphoribosyl transferase